MSSDPASVAPEHARQRLIWLDITRTCTLIGMIVFHFFRDLEIFKLIPRGTTLTGGWDVFSSLVAGTFLLISGMSFWLAHQDRVRWHSFLRRLGLLCLAAGLVSFATYLVFPGNFIRFGILHCIAASSLLGLALLRLPIPVLLGLAAVMWAAPDALRSDMFNGDALLWVGLSTQRPPALDYIPIFPWFGWFVAGIAGARLMRRRAVPSAKHRRLHTLPYLTALAWPGQHSLSIYLLHQPILLGLVWTGQALAP